MNKNKEHKKNKIREKTSIGNSRIKISSDISWYEKLKKFQALFLFVFAFILYANTLNSGYVLDDGLVIKTNPVTLKGFKGIGDILAHDQSGVQGGEYNALYLGDRYRPLSQVMFAIEYGIFGLSPFIGHLVNVLLYAFLSVMIFIVLKKMFKENDGNSWHNAIPFVAAAIFIAHPLHTEVVANIKSRDEIMGMLGGVLTILFSLKYLENKKFQNLILSFVFFLLGLLSKESAVTFIAIIPLTVLVFGKASFKDHAIVISPLIIASAIYFCLWFFLTGNIAEQPEPAKLFRHPFMYATISERYATIMLTWLKYLQLMIFPHPLTHDYYPKQIPIIGWGDYRAILSVILYVSLMIFSIVKIWNKNIIAFGILFFFITFSVTSNLFFDLGLFMNERFMFTFLLGFAIVTAYLLNKIRAKKLFNTIFILLMILYSVKTISRNTAWKSDYSLFTTDVKTSTNSGRCNVVAGSLILDKARNENNSVKKKEMFDLAESYLNRGLSIYSENIEGWECLGEVQIYLKQYDSAVKSLRLVFKFDSLNYYASSNLLFIANKYEEAHEYSKAISVYAILLKQKPTEVVYLYNVSEDYKNMGQIDSAIAMIAKTIRIKPDYYDAYNRIAEYYGKYKNDYDRSIQYLEKAYNMNPDYRQTLENLGIIYGIRADYKKSLIYFMKAYHKDSSGVSLCGNIAKTYELLGDKKKANEYYLKANELAKKKS